MREKFRNNALSPTEIRSLNPPILHPAELQFSKLNTAYIHIEFFSCVVLWVGVILQSKIFNSNCFVI